MTARARTLLAALTAAGLIAGCGASATTTAGPSPRPAAIPPSLLAGARPIGRGPRFTPPVNGGPIGRCAAPLGRRYPAHIEVFARNRVVLLAAGIGARPPLALSDGRLTRAACFGAVVTLDPTGTVYFRPSAAVTVGEVFAAWGQALSDRRIASFTGGPVRVYVAGRAQRGPAAKIRLVRGAEIVLEIGPYVPPHRAFTFPAPPPISLR